MDGEGNKKPWDASQLRKYDLTFDEIPRLHYKDPKIDEYIRANVSTGGWFEVRKT